ncbi:MAG: succinate dehydrogenase, hydrophobic membrane anchor protein [Rickettsiaceae bacterium]|nr:succinate dehydrogenase, hydrophobic membrane anchor protein [Rickettsiaceae bacterium]
MKTSLSLRSEISRAKNLGSSGHGSHHWIMQRISAVMLIPLFLWGIYYVISISRMSKEEILQSLILPYNSSCLLLLMISALYHSALGMQVVIEDYINSICIRKILIVGLKIFTATTIFFLTFAVMYFVLRKG